MDQDQEKKVSFLPFHAINEFMTDEYRLEVVRAALLADTAIRGKYQNALDRSTKQSVNIPGFRNSTKAPIALKIKPTASAFEKNPHLVATILAIWFEIHTDLGQKMFDLLTGRNWELLPLDADRTRLPGFITIWPKGQDFDVLNAAFKEKYPDVEYSDNDLSLMAVWLSGRLPYLFQDDDEETVEA